MNAAKKTLMSLALLVVGGLAQAHEITSCRSQDGAASSLMNGISSGPDAGKAGDIDQRGLLTLAQADGGAFDILFIDPWDNIRSLSREGAEVQLLRIAPWQITLIAHDHRRATSEIYTFYRGEDGRNRHVVISDRNGGTPGVRSGITSGTCDPIRFDLLF